MANTKALLSATGEVIRDIGSPLGRDMAQRYGWSILLFPMGKVRVGLGMCLCWVNSL